MVFCRTLFNIGDSRLQWNVNKLDAHAPGKLTMIILFQNIATQ